MLTLFFFDPPNGRVMSLSLMRPLIACISAASVLLGTSSACAQDGTTANEAARLREIEAQMEENKRKAAALREQQLADARAAEILRSRLIDIADGLQDAEAQANAIEDELARLAKEEAVATATLAKRQRNISDALAALQSLERSRPPALAVSPNDATQAAMAASALSAITPELQGQVEALRLQLQYIDELRAKQSDERVKLERTEAALAERERLLGEALAEREENQAKSKKDLQRIAQEDARLAREATNLRDLINRLNARGSTADPLLPGVDALPGGPEIYARLPRRFSQATSLLPWPAAGRLVAGFGAPIEGGEKSEDVTLSTRPGAVVTAPFGGEVTFADAFGRLGNIIILDVGENYSLVLIGVGRVDVRRGERVRAGEPLGQMGREGPGKIRFQIRQRNVPVNPMKWLQAPTLAGQNG